MKTRFACSLPLILIQICKLGHGDKLIISDQSSTRVHTMFRFISSPEALTSELEHQITDADAWAHIIPTGNSKPGSNAGALVLESYSKLKENVAELERKIQIETRTREESDVVLAQHIAKVENLLVEKNILRQETERIHDANSVLYNCVVCMDRQRTMRLEPCGHMATCVQCTEEIINIRGSLCPLCRVAVTRAQRTFLS